MGSLAGRTANVWGNPFQEYGERPLPLHDELHQYQGEALSAEPSVALLQESRERRFAKVRPE